MQYYLAFYCFLYHILGYLTITDFRVVQRALYGVHRKWYSLGLELDCSIDELDAIELKSPTSDQCLGRVLNLWLSRSSPRPTWEDLILALKEPTIGEEGLSIDIAGKYGGK